MKLKSLILGSVAAAGLSTAGFAADLGVLTSLDVCDSLGISGLTISSSDNCLQITGGVTYEFNWGDYNGVLHDVDTNAGAYNVPKPDGAVVAGVWQDQDWSSDVDAWLQFVGTASSDFGPASVTIKLDVAGDPQLTAVNGVATPLAGADNVLLDTAFVSVGDTTTLMAGLKSSIFNKGDDEPMNFLGLFNSEKADTGVYAPGAYAPDTGGHVIQIVSAVADGLTLKAGLENLNDATYIEAGTAVGVIEYAGNGIKAHISGAAGGVLDGTVEEWLIHSGFTGTFDNFTVLGAAAYGGNTTNSYWNVLGSAKATFDIFEIAISGEANDGTILPSQVGFGGSIGATVTEGIKLNLGGRWFDEDTTTADTEYYQVAAQIVAAVSETLTLTGEIGYFGTNDAVEVPAAADRTDAYASAQLAWAPGGGFTSSIKGQAHTSGAYKVTFKAAKEFK